jgi:hypothetical protein
LCKKVYVFEIIVPDLINDIAEEFCDAPFGRLITGKIIEARFVGQLCTHLDSCQGIVGNGIIVERKVSGMKDFFVAMVGLVLGGLREDGHKGMGSLQLVIGDDHEERKKFPPDGKQVVAGWFPFAGGEGVIGLFEEAGDGIGRHLRLIVAENMT